MIVIKDVAKYANVSISTVSKYFNHPEKLTAEYRSRIEKAVQELNYTPSIIARSIRSKKLNQLAVIVPDIANPFYSELFSNMRDYAAALGYRVIVYTTQDDLNEMKVFVGNIDNILADGVIICFLDEDEMLSDFDELNKHIPVTLVGWDTHSTNLNSVVVCINESFFKITQHVIHLGHKRIAFLNGPAGSRITKEKLDGFMRALDMAGLPIDESLIKNSRHKPMYGYHMTRSLMQSNDPPTAIICANDYLAIGCIKYLKQNEYHVPEDVVVTGHDGIQLAYIYEPTITTNAIPIPDICKSAVDMLIQKIERPRSKNCQAIFTTHLVEGKSTNPNAPNIIEM